MPKISIIIPVLNEAENIDACLAGIRSLRRQEYELILVDGGSCDGTVEIAQPHVDRIVISRPGRAHQMNSGANAAVGELLWFLHADSIISERVLAGLESLVRMGPAWGRFDVRLSGVSPLLRVVERMMNWRSRLTGIATGDQGIFVHRELFDLIGGWPEIPLMEDIVISQRLLRCSKPVCLRGPLITSSRRWESEGIARTIIGMWYNRLGFFLGVDPSRLAKRYYG